MTLKDCIDAALWEGEHNEEPVIVIVVDDLSILSLAKMQNPMANLSFVVILCAVIGENHQVVAQVMHDA
jgi:hypothetical protein